LYVCAGAARGQPVVTVVVLTSKGGLIAHGIPCAALHGSEVLQVDDDDDDTAVAAAVQQQQQQSQEDGGKLKHFLSIPPKLQSAAGYTSSGTPGSLSLHTLLHPITCVDLVMQITASQ
jgi:hypothetical protein